MDRVREEPAAEPPPARLLGCTCRVDAEHTVLMLEGEIDITTVDLLAEWLAAAAALERPIVIDLAGVTFLGSTGVQALLRARGLGPVQVRSARGVVARCLELTGLERLLEEPPPAPPGERWQPVPRC